MSNLLVGALICGARPISDTQNKWWVSAIFIILNSLLKEKGQLYACSYFVCVCVCVCVRGRICFTNSLVICKYN
jgi:hypothetical protein